MRCQRGSISGGGGVLPPEMGGRGFSMSTHLGLRFNNKIGASNSLGNTHNFTILYISRTSGFRRTHFKAGMIKL